MSKISVIIPVYNSQDYLAQCLDSLISQSHKDLELLIINDGSSDGSLDLARSYEKKDTRVRVFDQPNQGVSVARNLGLDQAEGDWVSFVDADDWADEDMFSFALERARERGADITIWSYYKNFVDTQIPMELIAGGDRDLSSPVDKNMIQMRSIYADYGLDRVVGSISAGAVWAKLYKRSFIEDNKLRFQRGLTRAQDSVFAFEAFERAMGISYFNKPLYHYRISASSTCSGSRYIDEPNQAFDGLLGAFAGFIEDFDKGQDFQKPYMARTIQVLMWHLKHKHFHSLNGGSFLEKRRAIVELTERQPYKRALEEVDLSLLPKKEKLMTLMFRRRLILSFYAIYSLYAIWEERSTKKYR